MSWTEGEDIYIGTQGGVVGGREGFSLVLRFMQCIFKRTQENRNAGYYFVIPPLNYSYKIIFLIFFLVYNDKQRMTLCPKMGLCNYFLSRMWRCDLKIRNQTYIGQHILVASVVSEADGFIPRFRRRWRVIKKLRFRKFLPNDWN